LLIPLEDSVQIQTLPPLPCTLDNLSAASLNNCVYVVGGNSDGIPSNKFFCMDLSAKDKGWKELSDIPGPSRVQPVLVAQENQVEEVLFLCGGFQPAGNDLPACLPTSMLVYSRSTGVWKEECSLPLFRMVLLEH
jgi:sialate O-acetylesterase